MICCILVAALLAACLWVPRQLRGGTTAMSWRPGATPPRFRLIDRLRSFRCALSGLGHLIRTEHNAWIHAAATVAVLPIGLWLGLSAAEWRWILLAVALVWMAEAFNTSLETLCDVVSPDWHPAIKRVKDIAASAVLITALAALGIGLSVVWGRVPLDLC